MLISNYIFLKEARIPAKTPWGFPNAAVHPVWKWWKTQLGDRCIRRRTRRKTSTVFRAAGIECENSNWKGPFARRAVRAIFLSIFYGIYNIFFPEKEVCVCVLQNGSSLALGPRNNTRTGHETPPYRFRVALYGPQMALIAPGG